MTVIVLAVFVQAELGDRALFAQSSSSCDKTVFPPATCSEDPATSSSAADDEDSSEEENDNEEKDSNEDTDIESKIPSLAGGGGVPFP